MSRPIISIILEFPTLLGGENSILAAAAQLRDRFEIEFWAPAEGELESSVRREQFSFIPNQFRNPDGQRYADEIILAQLLSQLQNSQSALIHANSISLARFLGRYRDQIPCPITAHFRDIMKVSKRACQELSTLDQLVCVSDAVLDHYSDLGVASEKLLRIYNGIGPLTSSNSDLESISIRQELGLSGEVNLAVCIGQVCLRKGQQFLIDAWCQLASRYPDWHLLFLGERYSDKAESIEYFKQMQQCVVQAGLQDRVHWLGYRPDARSLLPQCQLLIHPALQEPLGRVLLEAAWAKVPIIATNVGGTLEILTDQISARIVPPASTDKLQQVCEELMSNADRRSQLALQAHHDVRSRFSAEASASALGEVWQQAIGDKG